MVVVLVVLVKDAIVTATCHSCQISVARPPREVDEALQVKEALLLVRLQGSGGGAQLKLHVGRKKTFCPALTFALPAQRIKENYY
jgi:hypothetical protein